MSEITYKEDNLYKSKLLNASISINPKELNTLNIDELIHNKLVEKIGKFCVSDGIVNTDTITILSRSLGEMYNHDNSSKVNYLIEYEADVCNPYEGQIVKCIVDEHTDTQTICYYGDESTSPLEIYLSKQNYINNKEYANLKKGDKVLIRVVATNLETGRDKIDTIGEFLKRV
jgi:DNA-directed RNA polymerase subunit E'/Rpb7